MKQISFIINPIAGSVKKSDVVKKIEQYLNPEFNIDINYTQAPKDAIRLSRLCADKSDIVVAVGGDGSVNEVAQSLVGTDTIMGILPLGSGNGLARHLKIPMQIPKAIELINQQKFKHIDTLNINGTYSLNVSGLGFDAYVADRFAVYGKRGLSSYVKITMKEFYKYRAQKYHLKIDGKSIEREAFVIAIANSTQYGNNAVISPNSQIDDGFFEVIIVDQLSMLTAPLLGMRLYTNNMNKSKKVETFSCKSLEISSKDIFPFHIDGEASGYKKHIRIHIEEKSLKMLV